MTAMAAACSSISLPKTKSLIVDFVEDNTAFSSSHMADVYQRGKELYTAKKNNVITSINVLYNYSALTLVLFTNYK